MKRTVLSGLMLAAALAAPADSRAAGYVAHGALGSGPAAVRVWVEGGDVFRDYDDVTLWVRPERDCYTSLFLVDTAGFIHVLRVDDGADGWLYGGHSYAYRACDLGLDRLSGRGIAYVFAVGSPVPFDYSYYGAGIYVGGFGFRITGDPFVACREFYYSLLPVACRWDYVGVSFTRFYVREWVRYPSYLCAGGHVRVGDGCGACDDVYVTYRRHAAAPYEAIRPVARYKDHYTTETRHVVRATERRERVAYEPVARAARPAATFAGPHARRVKSHDTTRVVSTSREIARAPRFEKSGTSPVVAHERGGETAVAYKGRAQKNANLAQVVRGKGARQQVRRAE
jgi:hypothetical protein